jgi:chaperonin GroES
MAKISPLSDRVVAKREEASSKTATGLYLPDNAREEPKVAIVEAVGTKVKDIKAGDRILFKEYSTTEVKLDGTEYIILKEEDVLAVVK